MHAHAGMNAGTHIEDVVIGYLQDEVSWQQVYGRLRQDAAGVLCAGPHAGGATSTGAGGQGLV